MATQLSSLLDTDGCRSQASETFHGGTLKWGVQALQLGLRRATALDPKWTIVMRKGKALNASFITPCREHKSSLTIAGGPPASRSVASVSRGDLLVAQTVEQLAIPRRSCP